MLHVSITTRGYILVKKYTDIHVNGVLRYWNGKCVILGLLGFMVSGTISMTCTIERSLTSCFMAFLNYCTAVRFILRTYRPNEFLLCASNITYRWNQLKSYSCGKHLFTHSSRYDLEPKQLRLPLESEILVNQFHISIKVNISVYQWKAEWFYAFETRLSFIKISKIYYI